MKLVKLKLKNWRCFQEEIQIEFGNLTTLIGENDSGKSSIMEALNVFFEETKPDSDDGTVSGDKKDVRITCVFDDLPNKVVIDALHETDLASEHLLNSDGLLEVTKIYDCSLKNPKLRATLAHAVHPFATGVADLLSLKRKDLQTRADKVSADTSKIDRKINAELRKAIRDKIGNLELKERDISLDDEDARKIWEQLRKYLAIYCLFKSDRQSTDQDSEAQDPMTAVVKEAIRQKETELREISDFVINEVKDLAQRTVEKIQEMDPKLASELSPRISEPKWANVFKFSLVGDEEIPINKRGSGARRLILINFFRAKAERIAHEKGTSSIIYAIEEPETSQHPNNQRMVLQALSELAEQPNCQVILSTHTPMLGALLPLKTLRYVSKQNGGRDILSGDEETFGLVAKTLGVLPSHGVKLFIGVEGPNDISFIKGMSKMLIASGERVPDLEDLEEKGHVILIPLGGSNLRLWTSRLEGLNVPEIHIFDRDVQPPRVSPNQEAADKISERLDAIAILTGKREIENYIHPSAIQAARPGITVSFTDFDDVPEILARALHEESESDKKWDELDDEKKRNKCSRAKKWLNTEAVAQMTHELLTEIDPDDDVRGWLSEIYDCLKMGELNDE